MENPHKFSKMHRQEKCLKVHNNASREPKIAQLASKVRPEGAHMVPLLPTLEALMATWGIPLRIFKHFCKVLVNICAFLLKIHGKPTNNSASCTKKI